MPTPRQSRGGEVTFLEPSPQEDDDEEQQTVVHDHAAAPEATIDLIDGTTVVGDHQMVPATVPPALVNSPPFDLAPDYRNNLPRPLFARPFAYMDGSNLFSYLPRVYKFFQDINQLPWVADGRVTDDYIPGEDRTRPQVWYAPPREPSPPLDLTRSPEIIPESKYRRNSETMSRASRPDPYLERTQSQQFGYRQTQETGEPPPLPPEPYGYGHGYGWTYPGGYVPSAPNQNYGDPVYGYANGTTFVPGPPADRHQSVPVYTTSPRKQGYSRRDWAGAEGSEKPLRTA